MNVCLLLSSFERIFFKKTLAFSEIHSIIIHVTKTSGDDGEEATPVPMPNTEVKLFSADGSRGFPPVRVGHRQADFIPQ